MMRPSVQGVNPPVCCVLCIAVAYARGSFCGSPGGPPVLSRGGGGGGRHPGIRLTHYMKFVTSRFKVQGSLLFVTYIVIRGIISSEM